MASSGMVRVSPKHLSRRQKALALVAIGFVIFAYVGLSFFGADKTSSELDEWLPHLDHPEKREKYEETRKALRRIGTNAVPRLVRMVNRNDSWLKEHTVNVLRRNGVLREPFVPAERERRRALAAFRIIGPSAAVALPSLEREISTNNFTYVLSVAASFRSQDLILRQSSNTVGEIRAYATYLLGNHMEDDIAFRRVQVLLGDSDDRVRLEAVAAMAKTDRDISVSIPVLSKMMQSDVSADIQEFASSAVVKDDRRKALQVKELERQALIRMAKPVEVPTTP